MPRIHIQFFATLIDIFRKEEIILEVDKSISLYHLSEMVKDPAGNSLKDYIISPNGMDLSDNYIILVNGKNIHGLDGTSTVFRDDVEISIFPKIGGG